MRTSDISVDITKILEPTNDVWLFGGKGNTFNCGVSENRVPPISIHGKTSFPSSNGDELGINRPFSDQPSFCEGQLLGPSEAEPERIPNKAWIPIASCDLI